MSVLLCQTMHIHIVASPVATGEAVVRNMSVVFSRAYDK